MFSRPECITYLPSIDLIRKRHGASTTRVIRLPHVRIVLPTAVEANSLICNRRGFTGAPQRRRYGYVTSVVRRPETVFSTAPKSGIQE